MTIHFLFFLVLFPFALSRFEWPFWWFLLHPFCPELALGYGRRVISRDGEWLGPYCIASCVDGESISSPLRCFCTPFWMAQEIKGWGIFSVAIGALCCQALFMCALPSLHSTNPMPCRNEKFAVKPAPFLDFTESMNHNPLLPDHSRPVWGFHHSGMKWHQALSQEPFVQLPQLSSNLRR